MKKFLPAAVFALLLSAFCVPVYAFGNTGDSGVSITVVIPDSVKKAPAPAREPETCLYPVSVWESLDNGRREIIKTYELGAGEKPEDISRESFTREGWLYELADITRKETASADAKTHTETVSIDTGTNDIASILNLLAPTVEYQSEDGYAGVLELDIGSIKVETAGTKSSSYSVSAAREYPNLSSNDTSQIPKTIKDNGRTLTLSNIDWKTQNTNAVDYDLIAESYTAYASYTGTASKTTVTGYVTTAEYLGTVSKILTGRTVYTAYFIGVPIVTATVNRPPGETAAEPAGSPTSGWAAELTGQSVTETMAGLAGQPTPGMAAEPTGQPVTETAAGLAGQPVLGTAVEPTGQSVTESAGGLAGQSTPGRAAELAGQPTTETAAELIGQPIPEVWAEPTAVPAITEAAAVTPAEAPSGAETAEEPSAKQTDTEKEPSDAVSLVLAILLGAFIGGMLMYAFIYRAKIKMFKKSIPHERDDLTHEDEEDIY
jgi:hypothetical protein